MSIYKQNLRKNFEQRKVSCFICYLLFILTELITVSEICSFWDMPFAGCSEYKDTISRMGLSNMKNQQQYLKPLLPSRKFDDLSKVMQRNI